MARIWHRMLLGLAAALVLGGVFMLYAQPDFLLAVSDFMWSCFGAAPGAR